MTTIYKNKKFDEIYRQQQKLIKICIALSYEKNIFKLLEMIVDESRALTNADAGTLYSIENNKLKFEILQNVPLNIFFKKESANVSPLQDIPLYTNNIPNYVHASSYVALTGKIINIEDVYNSTKFDFRGAREYDKISGFRSKSMLVIPLKDHENDIIGVLQLINRKNRETGDIVPFSSHDVDFIHPLASQAAVALTKNRLILELKGLLYSFVKAIAWAIDAKSSYTGGHIRRVVKLSMQIAEIINKNSDNNFQYSKLNEYEMEELRLSAWMHDIGKIVTPQHIIDKSTRLESLQNGIELITNRFMLILSNFKANIYEKTISMPEHNINLLKQEIISFENELLRDLEFIKKCNLPETFIDEKKRKHLKKISEKKYILNGEELPYITEQELEFLSIPKGTLTAKERKIVEDHAVMTEKILQHLPFPKNLSNISFYASSHHEKLNGCGYPKGLSGDQIPLQARIMTIADIFEALTAEDRPYKSGMSPEKAKKILISMGKNNEIDEKLLSLCIEAGLLDKKPQ